MPIIIVLPPTVQKAVISRRNTHMHSMCVCYAGRANADVVFLNCPTSFAAVREFSIDIFVCQLQIVTLRVREAACFLDVRW